MALAGHLGVSRGTVREALRHLQQEGLVTAGNRNMLRVSTISPKAVRELFRVRAALEGLAVAEIIASAEREKAVATLRTGLSRLSDSDGDFATKLEADLGFHLLLCQLSGNAMLVEAWRYLEGRIRVTIMTMRALQAAARLEADHVDVAVLHVPTIKPLDREAILRVARTDRLVVTLENHTVIGGLSEAVASTLAFNGVGTRVVPIALPDEFLAAGALPTLHDRYGLSTDSIISRVKAELDAHATPADATPPAV